MLCYIRFGFVHLPALVVGCSSGVLGRDLAAAASLPAMSSGYSTVVACEFGVGGDDIPLLLEGTGISTAASCDKTAERMELAKLW